MMGSTAIFIPDHGVSRLRADEVARISQGAAALSLHAAAAYVALSRASFWRRIADGTLPKPVKLGGRSVWLRTELDEALQRAAAKRR